MPVSLKTKFLAKNNKKKYSLIIFSFQGCIESLCTCPALWRKEKENRSDPTKRKTDILSVSISYQTVKLREAATVFKETSYLPKIHSECPKAKSGWQILFPAKSITLKMIYLELQYNINGSKWSGLVQWEESDFAIRRNSSMWNQNNLAYAACFCLSQSKDKQPLFGFNWATWKIKDYSVWTEVKKSGLTTWN